MKVLLFDIETSPNIVYSWGMWQQNISHQQIIEPSRMLCFAAKYVGQDKVYFEWNTPKGLAKLHKLMNDADAICTYNGKRFDVPVVNKEFLEAGLHPPTDIPHIDLYQVAKSRFKLASNKLAYVLEFLKLPSKLSNSGFKLWPAVMRNERSAMREMREYCIGDVHPGLESLYIKLKPWIKTFPKHNSIDGTVNHCRCGAGFDKLMSRGYRFTATGKYQRYICSDCGTWSTSRQRQDTHVAVQ